MDARVALVTGGAHGIGRATVRRLRAGGARVMIADLDPDAARDLVDSSAEQTAVVHCDITDPTSIDRAVQHTVDQFGALDLLVSVAGGSSAHADLPEITDEEWTRLVDLNLTAVMRLVRSALPELVRSRRDPSVVAVSSVNGLSGWGDEPYSAAKAGLTNLVQNLAIRLGPQGIRVNAVAPGTIRTRVWDHQPDQLRLLERFYPLGRVGEPEDIAAAIAFLCSADAGWITGVVLPVDGGASAGPFQAIRAMSSPPSAE